ncbi:DNA-formamidopyrimidine glycosylase [Estrella lausannensis]|uniref:Formamidopyrimidine-DNA glycosylase n=1 Tax=Estrella lausannensis TaxID=483423 RepID=A0A0H5DR17_9BACT|nr:DNA-formamidopyrimidine glycosylase [Estrella lausannensis]CRX38578.1 hypothetical protein ELAC_1237 [Estrella lausannensis]
MPELPEVEAIRQDLIAMDLKGQEIESVIAFNERTLSPTEKMAWDVFFQSPRRIISIERKGKWLLLKLAGGTLFIHLRMSGKLRLTESRRPMTHERARLVIKGGASLSFIDPRKFGRIVLIEKEDASPSIGIDPTEGTFTEEALLSLLSKGQTAIKTWLLDQKKISGLGNIYVDEALFRAGIHPEHPVSRLSLAKKKLLYRSIVGTIQEAIKHRGTSLGTTNQNYSGIHKARGSHQDHLFVYSRQGKPCKKCRTPIEKVRFRGRGTHFCPSCQKPVH